jgi:hypothetical protein
VSILFDTLLGFYVVIYKHKNLARMDRVWYSQFDSDWRIATYRIDLGSLYLSTRRLADMKD